MWQLFSIQPKLYLPCIEHTVHITQNTGTVLNDFILFVETLHGFWQIHSSSVPEYTKVQQTMQVHIEQS